MVQKSKVGHSSRKQDSASTENLTDNGDCAFAHDPIDCYLCRGLPAMPRANVLHEPYQRLQLLQLVITEDGGSGPARLAATCCVLACKPAHRQHHMEGGVKIAGDVPLPGPQGVSFIRTIKSSGYVS